MALTFRGGIRLPNTGEAAGIPLEVLPAPERVILAVGEGQRILVKTGDRILRGQAATEPENDACAPLHAPFSGTVTRADEGEIEIENDQKYELSPDCTPFSTPISKAEPADLTDRIRRAGILCPDGAPLARILTERKGNLRRLVITALEKEPGLAADYRLIAERTREAVNGAKILLRAGEIQKAVFVTEKSHEDAADALLKLCGSSSNFGVSVVKTKYPQGEERPLVRALTGRNLRRGKTALEAGMLILNTETVLAVYDALVHGLPWMERVLSVGGDCLEKPRNLRVPLGASLEAILRFCGGLTQTPKLLLDGGAMTGKALPDQAVPVTKLFRGVMALSEGTTLPTPSPCIKCGACAKVCPERLYPLYIARAADRRAWRSAKSWEPEACIECGACAYVCPAGIPLLEKIRLAKDPPKKGEKP